MSKPLRLTVDLSQHHNELHSSLEDPLVIQAMFDIKFIPNIIEIIATVDHTIDYSYWKALLEGRANRLARIKKLILVGLNDHSAQSLALVLHDLRITPTDIFFDGECLN